MNNLVASGLSDAWQDPSDRGHVHSHNCACRKHESTVESNRYVSQLMNALDINPLYFGPDEPAEPGIL